MNGSNIKRPPVVLIVLSFILFFPVGFVLLYMRLTADKRELSRISKVSNTYAWVLFLLGLMYIILFSALDNVDDRTGPMIVILFFFILPALYLFYKTNKYKNLNKYYVWFYRLTFNQYEVTIDYLAESIHKSKNNVVIMFSKLIEMGLFGDAFIDMNMNKIVFPSNKRVQVQINSRYTNQPRIEPKQKVVTCNNCGASAAITEGKVVKCEYCNSFLA